MLWLKAFHIIFMVAWFAGLFYLPRLFVYHCEVRDEENYARFCTMERKLFGIMTIGATGTVLLGAAMIAASPAFMRMGWLHTKMTLAVGLMAYHAWLWTRIRAFTARANTRGPRFYRLTNEIPALLLIAIVLLVILKPF
jgi:putative membrane protein